MNRQRLAAIQPTDEVGRVRRISVSYGGRARLNRERKSQREAKLNQGSLEAFLALVNPDREQAGIGYCQLLDRLVRFFGGRGDTSPAEAADETIDRIAQRLEAGEKIDSLRRYSMGVARLVGLERYRRHIREQVAMARYHEEQEWGAAANHRQFELQFQCLNGLAEHEQSLLRAYYQGCEGDTRCRLRHQLAASLGLSISQLRLRVHRLCRRLKQIWAFRSSCA